VPHNENNRASIPARARPASEPSVDPGFKAEHVLLESEDVHETLTDGTRTISRRFKLRNRVLRAETVLVVFENGLMSIRETRRGQRRPEYSVDLRCLHSLPERTRHVATAVLGIAITLTAVPALIALLATRMTVPDAAFWTALGSIAAAPFAWWAFVRRTEERTQWRTRHGRATVLTLTAHLGCVRDFRATSQELERAIDEVRAGNNRDRQQMLRIEMREHYRLAEIGVLGADESAAAVRRTLAEFG
jgi:hypothetical protein